MLSPFDQTIQGLIQDPNSARIKKLLLYTCRMVWENNPQHLNQYNLSDLVQELQAIAPTLEMLRSRLNSVVSTINKSAEYMLVANSLVHYLEPLYLQPVVEPTGVNGNAMIPEVARILEQDPDQLRIKKLIYCACRNTWENNLAQLGRYSMGTLVQELHTGAPSAEDLNAILRSIVKTLNRQEVYWAIADKITAAFQSLYEAETGIHASAEEELTGFVTGLQMNAAAIASPAPIAHAVAEPTSLEVEIEASLPPVEEPKAPPTFVGSPHDLSDLFDLRLEVMKYTTPLRVKVLAYALIHTLPESPDKIWQELKTEDLDSLLRQLFQSNKVYCLLETRLYEIARQLPETSQYNQSIGVLMRLVKPLYESGVEGLAMTEADFYAQSEVRQQQAARRSGRRSTGSGRSQPSHSGNTHQVSHSNPQTLPSASVNSLPSDHTADLQPSPAVSAQDSADHTAPSVAPPSPKPPAPKEDTLALPPPP